MNFQNGYIKTVPWWGLFENKTVAKDVINDLGIALESNIKSSTKSGTTGDYVIGFILNNLLYVTKNNYYALVATTGGYKHIKPSFQILPIPHKGVLMLSAKYLDDFPAYTNAKRFCLKMSEIPAPQFCIPLDQH